MKKLICTALAVTTMLMLVTTTAFAQEPALKLSGEAKTGIYWEQQQYQGVESGMLPGGRGLILQNPLRLESHDGDPNGNRFRLNMDYDNGKSFGFRARIDWENWSNTDSEQPKWKYAFAYSNFFEDQLTVSIGKLGASPWGSGGPEKWKELEENSRGGGMRIEYKPGFIPEKYGRINAGFVLNWINSYDDSGETRTATLADILKESVLGISYTHDKFMARLAYRLDSNLDIRDRGTQELVTQLNGREGGDMVYRLEEYMLRNVVPGLQMWALGVYEGVFAADPVFYKFENWIFGQYDPPELWGLDTPFTAQIRVGYDYIESRSEFHVKPSFYWHFSPGGYSKLISVGGMFSYRQDFGRGKIWAGSPYQIIELEPKLQLNFSSSSIAFVYNWRQHYMGATWDEAEALGKDPIVRTQYINLRFCIYF